MNKLTVLVILLFVPVFLWSATGVSVLSVSGQVQVRYGLEETWHPVTAGLLLRDIDTIMTGSEGEVILERSDGRRFVLSNNSVLDIADLREIVQKELFLFLTTQKIKRIQIPDEKTSLQVEDVSIVHGSKKDADSTETDSVSADVWLPEFNGALALHFQEYFPNAVVKLHKILEKYGITKGSQKIYFYIGKSLEALKLNGQAIDAYQIVVDHFEQSESQNMEDQKRAKEARRAIKRLQAKG